MMRKNFKYTLHTNGCGYWTETATAVEVIGAEFTYLEDDDVFSEFVVYFDPKTWDINNDGLIYTDPKFLRELKSYLTWMGCDCSDLEYSEQGMQGENYVSFDAGPKMIKSWRKIVVAG